MPSVLRQNAAILQRARAAGVINHPHTRKIKQIQRTIRRNTKKHRLQKTTQKRQRLGEDQVFWVAAALQKLSESNNVSQYQDSKDNDNDETSNNAANGGVLPIVMEALVHIFINRNADELNSLKNLRNIPRGQIHKLEAIQQREESQFSESTKGFLVPPYKSETDVKLVLEWVDSIIKLDDEREENNNNNNFNFPKLPSAYISRTSTKSKSRRGNINPTEEFQQLVSVLKEQEGIGNHLIEYEVDDNGEDEQEQNDNDNDNENSTSNNSRSGSKSSSSSKTTTQKKRLQRRRFGKIKKVSSQKGGAKMISGHQIAIGGMARRVMAVAQDRDRRRKSAMAIARGGGDNDNDNNNNDGDGDEII